MPLTPGFPRGTALIQHSRERSPPREALRDPHFTIPSSPPRASPPKHEEQTPIHLWVLSPAPPRPQSGWRGQAVDRCSVKVRLLGEGTTCSGRLLPGNLRVCSAPGLPASRRNPSPRPEPRAGQTPSFINLRVPLAPLRPGRPPLVVGHRGRGGDPAQGEGRGGRPAGGARESQAAARGAGRRGRAHRPRAGPPLAGAPGLSHPARDAPPAPSHMTPPPPQTFSSPSCRGSQGMENGGLGAEFPARAAAAAVLAAAP